jgi:hypothetical protein
VKSSLLESVVIAVIYNILGISLLGPLRKFKRGGDYHFIINRLTVLISKPLVILDERVVGRHDGAPQLKRLFEHDAEAISTALLGPYHAVISRMSSPADVLSHPSRALAPVRCTPPPPNHSKALMSTVAAFALDNGAAPLPPMGMSTWDAFGFNVSSQKLMEWASKMVGLSFVNAGFACDVTRVKAEYGLRDAGYVYLLLDDGWTTCLLFPPPPRPLRPLLPLLIHCRYAGNDTSSSACSTPGPRDASGRIVPDPAKFPNGHKEWTDYAHNLGLKTGIYSAPHAQTCGGFTGSLGHEEIDAQAFADWGMDLVKVASSLCYNL